MPKKIIVIGAGPGGYPAALKAAALGAQVTLVEKSFAGGVCLNCGCIPSKSLLDAARRFYNVKKAASLSSEPALAEKFFKTFDFGKISQRRAGAIEKLRRGLLSLFKAAKIEYIEGEASFVSDKEISVNGKTLAFDAAVIAAGSKAFYPAPFDKYKDKLYDNSNIFNIPGVPQSITIIGGGVIGCEFACIFNALGSKVTVIEMMPSILPSEDEDCARVLKTSFEKRGIKILTGCRAEDITFENGIKKIILSGGVCVESQEVLVGVGRTADLSGLKPENAGISWTRKGIKADPLTLKVKDNIYAAGDVTGLCLLAHAASAQGETAAENIMGINAVYDNNMIPSAVYAWPEIASAGLTGAEAEACGIKVKVHKSFMMANGRAMAQDETEGFVKIIENAETRKIIGAQIAGAGAAELIHIPLVAMKAGMGAEEFSKIVFAHPTLSEAFKDAASR